MCIINLTASGVTSLVFCNFFYNISLCSLLATSSSTTAEALRTYFLSVLLLCASASASDSTQVAFLCHRLSRLAQLYFYEYHLLLQILLLRILLMIFSPLSCVVWCSSISTSIYYLHLQQFFTYYCCIFLSFSRSFFFLSPKWRMPSAATDLHTTTVTAAKNYRTLSSLCCHGDAAAAMVFASSLRMPLLLPPLLHATIIATPATTAIATTLFYSYYC